MAENPAILLNISEMIDLAIGTPECGVVDFNMLQTVLHVLAQQLHVLGKNVELRGSAANLPQYTGKEHLQTIVVNEFEYEIDKDKTTDKEKPVMKIATTAVHKSEEPDTILVVERMKKNEPPGGMAGGPPGTVGGTARGPVGGTTGGTASGNAGGTAGGTADGTAGGTAGGILGSTADGTPVRSTAGTTAGTAPTSAVSTMATSAGGPLPRLIPQSSTEKLSLVTASKFNILENAVEDLRNRVYGSIPKNDQILEEVRSQTNMKAITDMWTSLNVSSRLEAAEEGIAKLSSLVQDLIGETTSLQDSLSRRPTLAEANVSTLPMEQQTDQQASDPTGPVGTATGTTPVSGRSVKTLQGDDSRGVKKHLDKIRTDLDELTRTFYKAMEDIHGEPFTPPSPGQKSSTGRSSIVAADVMTRINELEKKLNKCCDSIKKNDGVIQDQINSFQDQLEGLMRQVATLTQDLAAGKLSPDLIKDLQGLMELFTTVQNMQEQLKQVHETALELAAEKDDRQHNIDALLEQIELLKAIKLDREDMFEAMADKADVRMLARKVSHDQFELACDDLAKGLEQTLGKLNLQEAIWQQALDDIQREIEMKLDKMELSPVKDFFNNKLRQLQDNLKRMASLRQEAEAAGTKKKLLRDVKCISCDAKAVMNAEAPSTVPVSRPLPANMSMKPYLSYELDAIRKTQQTNMPQRNMHDWEAIDKQMGPKPPPKPKSEGDKHLCNRYCGGSHTVTTAAQRVARLGHFVKQWGPDVLPLSSGLAAGDDGRLYKVTTTEAANVGPGGAVDPTCTPKPPPKENQEKPKPPPRPMVLSNECRCLDGGK